MVIMVRQPLFTTHITKLFLTNTPDVVAPHILVDMFLTSGTLGRVVHFKIDKRRVRQFLPVLLVKTL